MTAIAPEQLIAHLSAVHLLNSLPYPYFAVNTFLVIRLQMIAVIDRKMHLYSPTQLLFLDAPPTMNICFYSPFGQKPQHRSRSKSVTVKQIEVKDLLSV